MLEEASGNGRRFILYDISHPECVQAAGDHRSLLVGCDPHGVIHNTHTIR